MGDAMALTRDEKLRVGGYAAPRVRGSSGRIVCVTDKGGRVIDRLPVESVTARILERSGVELDVQPGVSPTHFVCRVCGRPFSWKRRGGGKPAACSRCKRAVCAGWDGPCPAQAVAPTHETQPSRIRDRGGEPWRCRSCVMKRAVSVRGREQYTESAKRAWGSMTPDRRAEVNAARSETTRKQWLTRLPPAQHPDPSAPTCLSCGAPLPSAKRTTCSARCRVALSKARRREAGR